MKKEVLNSLTAESFETYFKQLFSPLTYYAYKYLKDWDNAKDIVHQAFVKLWENKEKIDLDNSVKSYLYMTVTNLSLNYIRDHKKFSSTEEILESEYDQNEFKDIVQEEELKEKVIEAINSMPPKMREVFMLSRYEGLKYKEIAEKMGISTKTVEVHMSKALKLLRKNLSKFLSLIFLLLR